jgi:hypothetical protein
MQEILSKIHGKKVNSAAVPEQYPLLRTLQFAAQYWPVKYVPILVPDAS